jgi:hypothetical protein
MPVHQRSSTITDAFSSAHGVDVASAASMESGDNVRDRMAATGNMAVIAALMAGFAFSSLTTDIPDGIAGNSSVVAHFLAASSVTTGLSLILLFQTTAEYNFCMRELSAFGSDKSFKLVQAVRWQRRVGEVSFVLAIPSFAYSAGSMVVLKTTGTRFESEGWICLGFLAASSLLVLVILLTMQRTKKKLHKKHKLDKHKGMPLDARAGPLQLGVPVRQDRAAQAVLATGAQAKAIDGASLEGELEQCAPGGAGVAMDATPPAPREINRQVLTAFYKVHDEARTKEGSGFDDFLDKALKHDDALIKEKLRAKYGVAPEGGGDSSFEW